MKGFKTMKGFFTIKKKKTMKGFDVITYALVKKKKTFFHCCAYLIIWRLIVFFCLMRPLSKVETRRNSSFATV